MNSQTKYSLLARGFETELIEKIGVNGHTVSVLQAMSKKALGKAYVPDEVDAICLRIKRQPIESEILDLVISRSGGACCYCCDGNSSKPYQIHHIRPYSETQDNSEDNLMLICPTHHEIVPTTDSIVQQKSKRNRWQAIVDIAKEFVEQGIAFPFDRLSAISFAQPLDAAQLVHEYRISPSMAIALSDHELGERCIRRLSEDNFLVVVGNSGSGKTTLALGVAGLVSGNHKSHVFLFRGSLEHNFNDLQQVLQCLSCAKQNDVLILDDANQYLSLEDLATVAKAAKSKHMKVIATWTNNHGDDPAIERHLPRWILVTWEYLRDSALRFMISQEVEVSKAIQSYRSRDELHAVGLGSGDIPLQVYLTRVNRGAKTAAEFFFLLRGGKETIRKDLDQLLSNDRADIPVVFAAIEQIAGFEKAVSVDEVVEVCSQLFSSECSEMNSQWIRELFELQCKRGKMQRRFGRYTTIHRDYAKRLVSVAMASGTSGECVKKLLSRDYDCRSLSTIRWTILSSWFYYDEFVGPWIRTWAMSRSDEDWKHFIARVCDSDLKTIGTALDWLQTVGMGQRIDTKIVARELTRNAEPIHKAISSANEESWDHLKSIASAMEKEPGAKENLISPALSATKCGELLERTHPRLYRSASWFIGFMGQDWIEQMSKSIDLTNVFRQFDRVDKGDLVVFFELRELLRKLKVPTKRSDMMRINHGLRSTLDGAKVSELNIGFGEDIAYLLFFPQDYTHILEVINTTEWAREIEQSNPRDWRQIVTLIQLDPEKKILTAINENMSSEAISKNIKSKYEGNEYEMRCLLWFLVMGTATQRSEHVSQLRGAIRDSFTRCETERSFLYKVLLQYDAKFATELAEESDYSPESDLGSDNKDDSEKDESVLDEIRRQFAEMDKKGIDYIIRFDRIFSDEETDEPYWEIIE